MHLIGAMEFTNYMPEARRKSKTKPFGVPLPEEVEEEMREATYDGVKVRAWARDLILENWPKFKKEIQKKTA